MLPNGKLSVGSMMGIVKIYCIVSLAYYVPALKLLTQNDSAIIDSAVQRFLAGGSIPLFQGG